MVMIRSLDPVSASDMVMLHLDSVLIRRTRLPPGPMMAPAASFGIVTCVDSLSPSSLIPGKSILVATARESRIPASAASSEATEAGHGSRAAEIAAGATSHSTTASSSGTTSAWKRPSTAVHLRPVSAVFVGVIGVVVDGIIRLDVASQFRAEGDVENLLDPENDLLHGAVQGHASIGRLWGCGLVNFDVGPSLLSDLFDLRSALSDDATHDGLVDQDPDFDLRLAGVGALPVAMADGFVGHEGQGLLDHGQEDVDDLTLDGHDAFWPGAVRDSNGGVVVASELLNVGATLANQTSGNLAGNDHPGLELVAAGALVRAFACFTRASLHVVL